MAKGGKGARFSGRGRQTPAEVSAAGRTTGASTVLPSVSALSGSMSSGPGRGRGRGSAPMSDMLPRLRDLTTRAVATANRAFMTLRRYASNASYIGSNWPPEPLWQCSLVHSGRPSLTSDVLQQFRHFLTYRAEQDPDSPKTPNDLFANFGISISVGSAADKNRLGVAQDVVGFYVTGDEQACVNLLGLLNEFFSYRLHPPPTAHGAIEAISENVELLIISHKPSSDDTETDPFAEVCSNIDSLPTTYQRMTKLPVDVFAARTPGIICDAPHLQLEWGEAFSDFSGVLGGFIWPFRAELTRAQIPGAVHADTNKYFRMWPSCPLDAHGHSPEFDRLHRDCLYACAIRISVLQLPPDGTPAALFLKNLADHPNVGLRLPDVVYSPYQVPDPLPGMPSPARGPASTGAAVAAPSDTSGLSPGQQRRSPSPADDRPLTEVKRPRGTMDDGKEGSNEAAASSEASGSAAPRAPENEATQAEDEKEEEKEDEEEEP